MWSHPKVGRWSNLTCAYVFKGGGLGIKASFYFTPRMGHIALARVLGHQSSILQDFRVTKCQFSDIWPFHEDRVGTKDPHFRSRLFAYGLVCASFTVNPSTYVLKAKWSQVKTHQFRAFWFWKKLLDMVLNPTFQEFILWLLGPWDFFQGACQVFMLRHQCICVSGWLISWWKTSEARLGGSSQLVSG